jgi:hypothetical protein
MHILKRVKSAPKIFRCVETKENGDLEMCGKRNTSIQGPSTAACMIVTSLSQLSQASSAAYCR